jgi:hypothetical protein
VLREILDYRQHTLAPSLSSADAARARLSITEAADALVLYLLLRNRLLDAQETARRLGYTPEAGKAECDYLSKDVCQLIAIRCSALPRAVASASRYQRGEYSSLMPQSAGGSYAREEQLSGDYMEVEEPATGIDRSTRGGGGRSILRDLDGTSSFEYILYSA